MSKNNLTFESENILVDYLSFKFQHLEDWKEKELASYLLKLGFNCYKESGKLRKPIKEPILINSKNQFQLITKSRKIQPINQLILLVIGQSEIIRFYEKL